MSILWPLFLMGYQRYGIILSILMSILMAVITINVFVKSKNLFVTVIIVSIFACSNIVTLNLGFEHMIKHYAFIIQYPKEHNGELYRNNEFIFKDRQKQTISIDGVWGAIGGDSGIVSLIREKDTPIYILDIDELDKNNATEDTYKRFYDNVTKNKVYVTSLNGWFEFKLKELNKYGFKVVGKVKIYDNLMFTYGTNVCYVFQVEYSDEYVGKEVNKIEEMVFEY